MEAAAAFEMASTTSVVIVEVARSRRSGAIDEKSC